MLFTAVRSNSMYPLFQRGDMIMIKSLSESDAVKIDDIVVFKSEEGSLSGQGFVVHRIIKQTDDGNYITKGDANDYKDPILKREWIYSKAVTLGKLPVKIPLLGYLPLWMENFQNNPYAMPLIAVILAGIIGVSELTDNKKKKKKKKNNLDMQLLYFFSGLTISIVMAATMLTTSQRIVLPYEVSENNQGVIMGSAVGIMKVGDERTIPLADLSNKGFMPVTATITTKDEQLKFSHTLETLNNGDELKPELTLEAKYPGNYESVIHIGLFYPLLPKSIIYNLANNSYWLALAVVSLIPGLPLMLYPIIDKTMRRKTIKEIRRKIRRIHSKFIFN
jgi:signal peptidase I